MKSDSKGRIMGCGYCALEKECTIRVPKINMAIVGCKEYIHFKDGKTK